MCGRYYVDDETSREIRKILDQIDSNLNDRAFKTGEIFPTQNAPIISAHNDSIKPFVYRWGFPNYYDKGVMINARSETALEKKTFRESVLNRRCVIPANGFYEWDKAKNKYFFTRTQADILYMAGFYHTFQQEKRFIILTTAANDSMSSIHHRMPLILESNEINDWIFDNRSVEFILNKIPSELGSVKL